MAATARAGTKAPRAGVRALPPRPEPAASAPPALPEVPGDGILRFSSKAAEKEKRSHLFSIDRKQYTVLDNPPASLGLQYLDVQRTMTPSAVAAWVLEAMVGTDGLEALKNCKGLPQDGLIRVAQVCVEKLVASLEPPKEDAAD